MTKSPEQYLYMSMVNSGMKLHPGTLDSLREAIRDRNIYFFDDGGEPCGFVTWYQDCKDIVMNNCCIWGKKGIEKFFSLRKLLHEKYPNIDKIKWYSDKKKCEVIYHGKF